MKRQALQWKRVETDYAGIGTYAYQAHDPNDPNLFHFYWAGMEPDCSLDNPVFAVSWIDTEDDQDEHLGRELLLEYALALAEKHRAQRDRH